MQCNETTAMQILFKIAAFKECIERGKPTAVVCSAELSYLMAAFLCDCQNQSMDVAEHLHGILLDEKEGFHFKQVSFFM